jgi:hypothetical protein
MISTKNTMNIAKANSPNKVEAKYNLGLKRGLLAGVFIL